MTIEHNLDHLSGNSRKRDKHPARSARILTTGISIATVLGITSGYKFAETKKIAVKDESQNAGRAIQTAPVLQALQELTGPAPAIAAPQANMVVVAPETQPQAVKRKTIQVQFATPSQTQTSTTSSGSK